MAAVEDNYDNEREEEEEDADEQDGSSSSELAELEGEAKTEDEYPWRKGRLSTAQHGLKKFDRLFNPEVKQIILKSEAKLVEMMNELVEQVNRVQNCWESTDSNLGENIRKALLAINKISDSVIISLKTPNITEFFGRVFEYLKGTPGNAIVCLRILSILSRTHFDCLDLSRVEAVLNKPEYLQFLVDDVLEASVAKDTDLRIGQEALKKCFKTLLIITSRVNSVFAKNFGALKEIIYKKRLDFYSKKGLNFRMNFVPYKRLEKEDTDFVTFELQCAQNTDTKLSNDQTAFFYGHLIKNKNFKPSETEVQRIVRDASDLVFSIAKKPPRLQKAIINRMAGLLANLIFKPQLTEDELSLIINATIGFFDTIVDEFHPKTAFSMKKVYYQFLVQFFLTHYVREAKKCKKKSPETYAKIRDTFHPVLRKIMNFSIFDKFIGAFEKGIMALCYLDKEYFVDYLLNKIRFSFDFEEFRKAEVIKILSSIAEIYSGDAVLSNHLLWIIPKLLGELSNSAEAKKVEETGAVIASILENFVGLEGLKEKSHLLALRDDIDEAAIRYLDFYLSKADTYTMRKDALRIVATVSEFTNKKVREKLLQLIRQGFSKVSTDNVQNFLSVGYRLYPKEFDEELTAWIKKKVLNETEAYALNTLTFGPSLSILGLQSPLTVKLSSGNETTLKDQSKVLRGVMQLSYLVSEDLLRLSTSALAMIADHDNDEVSKDGIISLGSVFNEVLAKISNLVSVSKIKETTTSKDGCSCLIWEIPELSHTERLKKLVQAFLFEQFSEAYRQLDIAGKRETSGDAIPQLYRDTLAEKSQDEAAVEQADRASVKKIVITLRLIALLFKGQWVRSAYLNSFLLQKLFTELKQKCLAYFAKSGTFKNPKLRDCYLSLLITNIRVSNLALEGEEVYKLYLKAMQGYYAYFDEIDSSFRIIMMEMILNNYLTFYGYFFSHENFDFDSLAGSSTTIEVEPHKTWLFGGHLEQTFVKQALDELLENSVFFPLEGMHLILQKEIKKHLDRWMIIEESSLREKLLGPMLRIMAIEQGSSEKYSATSQHVREAVYLFMSKIYIEESQTVEDLLELAKVIAVKSDFSKVQSLYFQFTNYLLLSSALSLDSKWRADFGSLNRELRSKDDSSLTLADLIQYSVKLLLTYKTWTVEDRAEFCITCLNGAASKNINKRIVFMSMLFFLNRLMKKTDWSEDKIVIYNEKFVDGNGILTPQKTQEIFQQIKYNIGFSSTESSQLTEDEKRELSILSPSCFPGQASQYLTLPFEVLQYKRTENTVAEFRNILQKSDLQEQLESSFLDFLKIAIMEYSDSVEESNLSVKYSYAEYMVSIEKKGAINRESLILVTFKQASLFFGVNAVRRIMKKLDEEVQDKNSDYKKVVLIMYCSLLSSSNGFNDEEFEELLVYGRELLVPLMNSINAKHLQTLMVYLFVSLKSSLNFARMKTFYDTIIEEMKASAPENKSYYLNILVFQVSTSALMLTDSTHQAFSELAPSVDLNDLNNVRTLAKFYGTILAVRYQASFSLNFQPAATEERLNTELTLLALNDKGSTVGQFIEFLRRVKNSKLLTRMECLKSLLMLFHIKGVDKQNYEFMEELISIIFTLDPNEDLGISQLVAASHKVIEQMRNEIWLTPDVRDRFLTYLSTTYDGIQSVDCLKSLIKMIRRGVGTSITPALHDLLFKVARDSRVTLREAIDSLYRHDVFSCLSNRVMYAFAKDLFRQVDTAVAEK